MVSSFVIDASVIVSWYNPDEQNDYAKDILFCLRKEQAVTPCLCFLEVNNVLQMIEKKGKLSSLQVDKALAALDRLRIARDGAPEGFQIPLVLRLSREYGLTIYDACYLELAVRLNLPIASLDNDLIKAANAAEIALKTAIMNR
ncbi:MAG: type II toxin-antitoxin system VapC family toxin [Synergistaceae bacterium]|jgi:predicted nucleic acid-binding protein|nr:type II toxin-antitoxin system VapC family toxin [Synergistaceae bacterium]